MGLAMNLRQNIRDRLDALRAKKQELIDAHQGRLASINAQIDACQTLRDQWDTLPLEMALALLRDAGMKVEIV